jgi:ketosteroid isomerase-like protein
MLSTEQIMRIEAEVEQAATAHLHAGDLDTALSHFTGDVLAVSNTMFFPSRDALAADIGEYYRTLKEVLYASWEDVHIHVISESAATFTARFSYGFTSMDDESTDLRGVWTALFVLVNGSWKIRLRHESFEQE